MKKCLLICFLLSKCCLARTGDHIVIEAVVFGAPVEDIRSSVGDALPQNSKDRFQAPKVLAESGKHTVIEVIKEFRFPIDNTAVPETFKTLDLGLTVEVTATTGNSRVLVHGVCRISRLVISSGASPDDAKTKPSTQGFLTREVYFAGSARNDIPFKINLSDDPSSADKLLLTFHPQP